MDDQKIDAHKRIKQALSATLPLMRHTVRYF